MGNKVIQTRLNVQVSQEKPCEFWRLKKHGANR